MKPQSKGATALGRIFAYPSSDSICLACQRTLRRRQYASAATATIESEQPTDSVSSISSTPTTVSRRRLRPAYHLHAGVVLSRAPIITRDLHPFEKAFLFYQRRLNERLALPFTRYFYYKTGTPADLEWKRKAKERLTPARDIGVYNAYGKDAWNDEVLMGAKISEPEDQVRSLLEDAEAPVAGENVEGAAAEAAKAKREEIERPMGRISAADEKGDFKSLDRLLQRSLYLLVKGPSGRWTFPSAELLDRENLRQAAERIIVYSGGPNMNTWIVGNAPVGHYMYDFPNTLKNDRRRTLDVGEKVFFMKAKIMAGQANLDGNKLGLEDFRWLAKEEIQKLVTPKYWSMTEDMLADR